MSDGHRNIDLYNDDIHGDMPRRGFLRKLVGLAGVASAAKLAWSRSMRFSDHCLKS